jgi:peptidyl-prolyl cis-trans isomerase C
MKNNYLYTAACIVLLLATAQCSTTTSITEPAAPQSLVTVNGTPITQEQIDTFLEQKMAGSDGRMSAEQLEQMKAQMQDKAVESFVTRTVLLMECEKENITATPQEIEDAIEEMRSTLPEGMTIDDALESTGMSLAGFHEELSFNLCVKKLFEINLEGDFAPSDDDVRAFYEQNTRSFQVPESVQARHILIRSSEQDDASKRAEKKARAEELRTQLLKGADFARVAAENSDCPSKSRGGNLGTFERGRMVKPFEEAAFSQNIDEIGPVVETRFGYHIIQVQSRTPASQRPFNEVRDQIEAHLEQKNRNTAIRTYIDNLKSNATIVYAQE